MHKKAYEMYSKNLSLTDIAASLGVTRQTVSNWKKKERWDELLLSEHTLDAQNKEREFLIELIKEWDKTLTELRASDIAKKLTLLERYTKTYYKLKNINKDTPSAQKLKKERITKECIVAIADMALKSKHTELARFLQERADEILAVVEG